MDVKYDAILGKLREKDSGGGGAGGVDSATVSQMISAAINTSVGSGAVEIYQGGTSKGSFNVNQSGDPVSITLDAPGTTVKHGATVVNSITAGNDGVSMSMAGNVLQISGAMTSAGLSSAVSSAVSSSIANSVGAGLLKVYQGGVSKGEFSANQSGDPVSITLDAPGTNVVYSGAVVHSMSTGNDLVSMSMDGSTLQVSGNSAAVSSMISGAIATSTGRGAVVIKQGGVSKGQFNLESSGGTSVTLDPAMSYDNTVVSTAEGDGVSLSVVGGGVLKITNPAIPVSAVVGGNTSKLEKLEAGSGVTFTSGAGTSGVTITINAAQVTHSGSVVSSIVAGNANITMTVAGGVLSISGAGGGGGGGGDPVAMRNSALVFG